LSATESTRQTMDAPWNHKITTSAEPRRTVWSGSQAFSEFHGSTWNEICTSVHM
jgi:hypothetical protein